jgi:hypothetical protein
MYHIKILVPNLPKQKIKKRLIGKSTRNTIREIKKAQIVQIITRRLVIKKH